jgi:hypothetical protein
VEIQQQVKDQIFHRFLQLPGNFFPVKDLTGSFPAYAFLASWKQRQKKGKAGIFTAH